MTGLPVSDYRRTREMLLGKRRYVQAGAVDLIAAIGGSAACMFIGKGKWTSLKLSLSREEKDIKVEVWDDSTYKDNNKKTSVPFEKFHVGSEGRVD